MLEVTECSGKKGEQSKSTGWKGHFQCVDKVVRLSVTERVLKVLTPGRRIIKAGKLLEQGPQDGKVPSKFKDKQEATVARTEGARRCSRRRLREVVGARRH